jgi:hypothetical protein
MISLEECANSKIFSNSHGFCTKEEYDTGLLYEGRFLAKCGSCDIPYLVFVTHNITNSVSNDLVAVTIYKHYRHV